LTGDTKATDLLGPQGTGPLWGMASSDLNATLLAWPAGHELEEHANPERDVLLVVLEGGGRVRIDWGSLCMTSAARTVASACLRARSHA
jgi:hypothetical protein